MRWSGSAAALTLVAWLVASPAYAQHEETERFARTVRLGEDGRFSLENLSGSVTVTGVSGGNVAIEAVKRTRGDRSELDDVGIEVDARDGRVSVRTTYPRDAGGNPQHRSVSVDYTISVPFDAETNLETVSGAMSIVNVRGEIRAQTVSGGVSIRGAEHVDAVRTVSGSIDIFESRLRERAEVSLVAGRVTIRDVSAPAVQLKGISGDLELRNSSITRLTVSLISGNMESRGALPPNGRYDLTTHSGTINVVVPADAQFEVNAATLSGAIRFGFPGTVASTGSRRTLQTTVGRGGTVLTLRSFSGRITIDKQ